MTNRPKYGELWVTKDGENLALCIGGVQLSESGHGIGAAFEIVWNGQQCVLVKTMYSALLDLEYVGETL